MIFELATKFPVVMKPESVFFYNWLLSMATLIHRTWFSISLTSLLILFSHLRIDLQNHLVQILDWYLYGCIRGKQNPGGQVAVGKKPYRRLQYLRAHSVEFGSCRPVCGACNFEVAPRFLEKFVHPWCICRFLHACYMEHPPHGPLFNPLTPNDPYRGRTAPLTSKRFILYIYSTNTGTEYFKHGIYSPFFFHFKMQFVSQF